MPPLIILLNIALGVGLVGLMVVQGLSRKVELLSCRNCYLAGFIVYQIISPSRVVLNDGVGMFDVIDAEGAAWTVLGYCIAFLPCYLVAYHYSVIGKWIAGLVRSRPTMSPDMSLLLLAMSLNGVGIGARILGTGIPVIQGVGYHFSIGLAVVACGLVGWVWAKRRANLAVVVVGAVVFFASVGVSLQGAFGRRSLLTVAVGLLWGAYYGFGKRLKPGPLIAWLTPLALVSVVLVAMFTQVRGRVKSENLNTLGVLRAMSRANVSAGVAGLVGGQQCGSATLWCVENYPRYQDTRPLFSLRQIAHQFIPRFLWPEKPKPLANSLAKLARVRGVVHSRITLTPGVIGYAAAEGGFYAVVLYGLFFGGFTRLFDQIVQDNLSDPYIIAVSACTLGNFLGLARGDLANFTVNIAVTFVSTYAAMWCVRRVLGKPIEQQVVYWRLAPAPPSSGGSD